MNQSQSKRAEIVILFLDSKEREVLEKVMKEHKLNTYQEAIHWLLRKYGEFIGAITELVRIWIEEEKQKR